MRISWGYIVGGVVLAGAAVAIYDATSNNTPERPPPVVEAPATPSTGAVAVPKPDEHFDKVPITADDHVMGSKDAKVTMVEYASLTCPHCAALNVDVMPRIKKEYVDTGKVRYVYRDFPLDQLALAASVLARCAGPDRYFGFVDTLFSSQRTWVIAKDPSHALEQIGKLGGVSPEAYEKCRKDEAIQTKVLEQRMTGDKTYHVNATPTLIVNGDKYARGMTYEELKAVLDEHLSKAKG